MNVRRLSRSRSKKIGLFAAVAITSRQSPRFPIEGFQPQRIPNSTNPIQIPSERGHQINVLGMPMFIRIHGRDTGGAVEVVKSHDVAWQRSVPSHASPRGETSQILESDMREGRGCRSILFFLLIAAPSLLLLA